MKKVFSLILALGLIASLTACGGGNASGNETGDSAPAASTAKLRFVTGGESGTYYAFGSVIAQHATNNTDVSVTGLVGNGSKSNVEELADGNAELAFCQSDVMAYAYNGTNLFENPIDCFSTVAALYMEDVQIVTTDPSIKTVADLAGKNVSVGAAGSGVYSVHCPFTYFLSVISNSSGIGIMFSAVTSPLRQLFDTTYPFLLICAYLYMFFPPLIKLNYLP